MKSSRSIPILVSMKLLTLKGHSSDPWDVLFKNISIRMTGLCSGTCMVVSHSIHNSLWRLTSWNCRRSTADVTRLTISMGLLTCRVRKGLHFYPLDFDLWQQLFHYNTAWKSSILFNWLTNESIIRYSSCHECVFIQTCLFCFLLGPDGNVGSWVSGIPAALFLISINLVQKVVDLILVEGYSG